MCNCSMTLFFVKWICIIYDIHDKNTLIWLQLIWLRGTIYCYMSNCFLVLLPYNSVDTLKNEAWWCHRHMNVVYLNLLDFRVYKQHYNIYNLACWTFLANLSWFIYIAFVIRINLLQISYYASSHHVFSYSSIIFHLIVFVVSWNVCFYAGVVVFLEI